MGKAVGEKEYEIHFYEIDYKKNILITALIDYFNDVCMDQSEKLGIGLDYIIENGVTWMLYKWDITIKRYPKYREKIKVTTEPYAFKKFYGYRKFSVLDSKGEVIATANSVWILINIENKRPLKIPESMINAYGILKNENSSLKIGNIKKIEKIDNEVEFKVRYSDIDTNGHVNNEKYAAWMIESVPLDVISNNMLKNIKITYKKETKYGERIKVLTENDIKDDKIIFYHKIIKENGEELTLGQTVWEKN